jgi:hypothetical protein
VFINFLRVVKEVRKRSGDACKDAGHHGFRVSAFAPYTNPDSYVTIKSKIRANRSRHPRFRPDGVSIHRTQFSDPTVITRG